MQQPQSNNRRQFLKNSALGCGAGYWMGSALVRASNGQEISPDAFQRLKQKIQGSLVLPGDTIYENAKRVFYWNPATQSQPMAIVRCERETDAIHAVEFARDHQLQVAVRGGGHSYLAWGSCNGLVIDLSALKAIEIDPSRRIVRAQGGVLAGQVARAASRHGLVPVFGQCPGVGAVGVTLGGGLGWLSGLYGACCDNLQSAKVINANAETLEANEQADGDLLWAMRGAGANFGVTTSFEAKLHPIETVVGGDIHFAVADASKVLRGFRELMQSAPDGFQANLNLTQGDAGVFISLCHVGPDAEVEVILNRIRKIAKATRETVKRQLFADLAEKAAATSPANVPAPAYRAIQTVYRREITDDIIEILVDQLKAASKDVVFGLSHYMHGAVCRVDSTATAFPHRQQGSIHIRAAYSWSYPQESNQRFEWGQTWLKLLRANSNESLYANFQTYETQVGSPSLFGQNHARLLAIKQKHDPENFFRRNANVAKPKT